ncbi:hypothetical protein DRO55_00115 [Candidatus Bathyarchaeota archaeon]|nr:MAG: hypothetical protein DRO55_00115 [Candidatus Bathyarchaeota archaeon]
MFNFCDGELRETLFCGRWEFIQVVQLSEVTVKVDRKGRIVIPSNIRRRFNIKKFSEDNR